MTTPERVTLVIAIVAFLTGFAMTMANLWRIKREAARRMDEIIRGKAGERSITVRRPDGALVTTVLNPYDPDSIERFLDTVRVPEPRATPRQEAE